MCPIFASGMREPVVEEVEVLLFESSFTEEKLK